VLELTLHYGDEGVFAKHKSKTKLILLAVAVAMASNGWSFTLDLRSSRSGAWGFYKSLPNITELRYSPELLPLWLERYIPST